MRNLCQNAWVSLALVLIACGGRQEPACFECGLSQEWERAERAEAAQQAEDDAASASVDERGDAEPADARKLSDIHSVPAAVDAPAALSGKAQPPGAGGVPAAAAQPPSPPSNDVRDKPGYCGTPGCGSKNGPLAVDPEEGGYESEFDRPDYCGTPGCGQGKHRDRDR